MKRIAARAAGLVLAVLFATGASAATWEIRADGSGAFTTIMAAVTACSSGDVLDIGAGVWTESVEITKSLTLVGHGDATVMDGTGNSRHLWVHGLCSVMVSDIAFVDGYADNGSSVVVWQGADASFTRCTFSGNHAYESNAMVVRHVGTHVVVTQCIFRDNTADVTSAAIGVGMGAVARLEDSVFENNRAYLISGAVNNDASRLDVTGCLFIRNGSKNTGALVYSEGGGIVANNTFFANSGPINGSVRLWPGTVFEGNIVAGERSGPGVADEGATRTCNLYFDNVAGDLLGGLPLTPTEWHADPLFCDWAGDVFTVCAISPALPEVNGCGAIGAFGEGCDACGPVASEPETWGGLQARFR